MAFTPNSLTAIAFGSTRPNGSAGARRKLHLYVSDDAHTAVGAADYFLPAQSRLTAGDIIISALALGGTPQLRAYIVTASTAATVTVAQLNNA